MSLRLTSHVAISQNLLSSEKLLYGSLERALAEMTLIKAQLEFSCGQILRNPEKQTAHALFLQLLELEESKGNIDRELDDWENAAKYYLELALGQANAETIGLAHDTVILIQQIRRQSKFNAFLIEQNQHLIRAHYVSFQDRFFELWERLFSALKNYSKWS